MGKINEKGILKGRSLKRIDSVQQDKDTKYY